MLLLLAVPSVRPLMSDCSENALSLLDRKANSYSPLLSVELQVLFLVSVFFGLIVLSPSLLLELRWFLQLSPCLLGVFVSAAAVGF